MRRATLTGIDSNIFIRNRRIAMLKGRLYNSKAENAYPFGSEPPRISSEIKQNFLIRTLRKGSSKFADMIGAKDRMRKSFKENVIEPINTIQTEKTAVKEVVSPKRKRLKNRAGIGSVSFHMSVVEAPTFA